MSSEQRTVTDHGESILDGVTFEVRVTRLRMRDRYATGPWLVRVYAAGEHIHSAEGGVSISTGLREAERVMREYVESYSDA